MQLQPIRGTHDLLPAEQERHNLIVGLGRKVCGLFGYREMSTPIMEFANVFKRTLGDASDIVNKEMYTFSDRGGEEITLRPEGTASVARAFISEGLSQKTPLKVFYQGPMFRYERPQKGRQRQFHQFGIELMGAATPFADTEVIALAYQWLRELQILDQVSLELNSIGDDESRAAFKAELVKFLSSKKDRLSEDSKRRLETNPLRILDSKDPNDQELLSGAPQLSDSLTAAAKEFYDLVKASLTALKIPFNENSNLVRGLDYYSHTVFEFRSKNLGAQDAVLSGGRYDQLVKLMGGPDTPSVGWAAGLERLSLLTPLTIQQQRSVAVIPVHGSVEAEAFVIANQLRQQGVATEISFSGNMSKRMKKATNLGCSYAILIGPDEIQKGVATVKNLDAGTQETVAISEIAKHLQ